MNDPTAFWDARYAEPGYAYGEAPNDFLVEVEPLLPRRARVLCLAEGEGRNAVFLAERGHAVTALDLSSVGLEKARALAARRGVSVETVVADLGAHEVPKGAFDAIVAIWMHLPPPVRARALAGAAAGLAPGGVFALEGYRKEQLALGTGGPKDAAMLFDAAELGAALEAGGLVVERLEVVTRDVREGPHHAGESAVVQVVARRPAR